MNNNANTHAPVESSDDDDEYESLLALQFLLSLQKNPYHTSALTGMEYIQEILDGPVDKCHRILRMNKKCFLVLCEFIRSGNYLEESPHKHLILEERVAIFFYIVGHSHRHRVAADRFQHSTETINRHFKEVLRALASATTVLICPPDTTIVHEKIANFHEFYPWFKGAVGAVDGTLIDAWAPSIRHNSCRARKGNITQNMLAACDFNMMFTFVYSGWEGSANDSRVILEALQSGMFQRPSDDKYYLVDCGYSNMPGFLVPYRGERYHLHDFDGVGNEPIHERELFNRRHARLRNVIERTFGVFKKRFPIFKFMSNYKPTRQVLMVNACCGLHNFIRRYSMDDSFFASFEGEDFVPPFDAQPHESNIPVVDLSQQSLTRMTRRREVIAQSMWNAEFG